MGMFRRFKADQRGATAIVFGLAALPLITAVGAAVDYTRASAEHARLQSAADATALALVREPATLSPAQFSARGARLFDSIYKPSPGVVLDDVSARRLGQLVIVSRKGRMTNAFMKVAKIPTTEIGTEARASGSMERIELALVLDNTGSMGETIEGTRKIDALKQAAAGLVDQLRGLATDPDAVRLSVVPFDTEVRVDADRYRNRDWIGWNNPSSQQERRDWTGYMVDRLQPYDVSDAAPAMSVEDSLYPVRPKAQTSGELAPVRPLTSLYERSSYDAVKATISRMEPRGNTNVGLGVSWGTATLTGSVPLDAVASTDSRKPRRFMIVLTDGINTQHYVNRKPVAVANPGNPSPVDPVLIAINDRTRRACETAKDPKGAAIEVFTIRLLDGDKALLSGCASSPNKRVKKHYFDVQSKPDLEAAFRSILESVGEVRITS